MDVTIEPLGREDGVMAVEHGFYEESSVLAGQSRRQVLGFFDSVEEAKKEYPNAEVLGYQTRSGSYMSDIPPSDFDPADAGERWEEDY